MLGAVWYNMRSCGDNRIMEDAAMMIERREFVGFSAAFAVAGCRTATRADHTLLTLTFDDAPKGHLSVAAPALEKFGLTGCFNIVTDWIGRPHKLTWDDVRELKRRGHEIASHGKSHVDLVRLLNEKGAGAVCREVEASRDAIAEAIGEPPTLFCHPFISHNAAVDALIRECGMIPYFGPRRNIGSAMTPASFAALVDELVVSRKRNIDILFHGVSKDTGGWNPVATAEYFEAMMATVADRRARGDVEVVPYATYAKLAPFAGRHLSA